GLNSSRSAHPLTTLHSNSSRRSVVERSPSPTSPSSLFSLFPHLPFSSLHFIASVIHVIIVSLRTVNDRLQIVSESFISHVFVVTATCFAAGNPISELIRSATSIVYVLGLTVTVYYHAAGFRGNAIDFRPGLRTTFPELLSGLRSGSRQLITLEANAFGGQEIVALFGKSSAATLTEPYQIALMQRLCDDKKLVAMVERNMVAAMSLVKRPCLVDIITVPKQTQELERLGTPIMQNYLFSRNLTSRRIVDRINQILLRIFPQERIESFWTKRYLSALRLYSDPTEEDYGVDDDYAMPMSLARLELLFFITIPCWISSLLLFTVEAATSRTIIGRLMNLI
ncbi:hypothetical protein PFISCL1PPCAC_4273, partial [Pristionchus fissidentatus]